MKLLLISALLLALSTLPADGTAVYDTSGDILRPGTPYTLPADTSGDILRPGTPYTLPADGTAVYDTSGDILKPGTPYYIKSAFWGPTGGGLFPLFRPRICSKCRWCCPLNVAQKSSNHDRGLPVYLSPSNSGEEVVHLLTDLKIEFTSPPSDGGSPVWKLDSADSNGQRYVTLNGDPSNTIDVNNWFKIDKAGPFGYKLLYCPSVAGNLADSACGSLGKYYEDGNRWLVLSDNPFLVVFVKA